MDFQKMAEGFDPIFKQFDVKVEPLAKTGDADRYMVTARHNLLPQERYSEQFAISRTSMSSDAEFEEMLMRTYERISDTIRHSMGLGPFEKPIQTDPLLKEALEGLL